MTGPRAGGRLAALRSPEHDRERIWPVLVVGGGPGAALQVFKSGWRREDMLVLAERLGGIFAVLGEQQTQSYADELNVGAPTVSLGDYLRPGIGQPTGSAYARYVRDALTLCGSRVDHASVDDVRQENGAMVVTGTDWQGRPARWRAERVVLATGCKPKGLGFNLGRADVRSCVDVYRDIDRGHLGRYRRRSVVVIGCGNTAMQLAGRLAWSARQVIVLASRYVGLYPFETMDRFGWRAASQLTCELIVRSRQRASSSPPLCQPMVRYLVYDALNVAQGRLSFTYSRAANDNVLGRHSMPDGILPTRAIRPDGPGRWREELDLASTVVVVATGFAPSYPCGSSISALSRDADGVLRNRDGEVASFAGLYLAGACAGYPSVNFMTVAAMAPPSSGSHATVP